MRAHYVADGWKAINGLTGQAYRFVSLLLIAVVIAASAVFFLLKAILGWLAQAPAAIFRIAEALYFILYRFAAVGAFNWAKRRAEIAIPAAMNEARQNRHYVMCLLLVCALAFALSTAYGYGPTPINGADDYIYANMAYAAWQGQFNTVAGNGLLAQRFLTVYGTAAFYFIFGPTVWGEAAFGIFCLLLTIIAVYKIGSVVHSRNAGILSAFFYSFFPLPAIYASNVGADGPMALTVTLAVMFLVMAIKREGKRRCRWYYALSGFFGMIGMLASPEALMLFFFLGIVLAFYMFRSIFSGGGAGYVVSVCVFAAGVLVAAAIIAGLGWLGNGNALYVFTINNSEYANVNITYSQVGGPLHFIFPQGLPYGAVTLSNYLHWLFPYAVLSKVGSSEFVAYPDIHNLELLLQQLITLPTSDSSAFQSGLFGYYAVLAAAYMLLKMDTRALVPATWLVTMLGYLGVGTVSLQRYVPIVFSFPRYGLIYAPAVALLIGFGLAALLETRRGPFISCIVYGICIGAVVVLLLNSISLVRYVDVSQYMTVSPMLQAVTVVEAIPDNALIYGVSTMPENVYSGFRQNMAWLPLAVYSSGNCSSLSAKSYLLIRQNASLQQACGLKEIWAPKENLTLVNYYSIFRNATFGDLYGYRLYYYRGG